MLHSGNDAPVTGHLRPRAIRAVLDHIDRHIDTPLPVHTLAAVAGVSTGHFCRAFKATFGTSARMYIMRQRLERALPLISQSRLPLGDIALACGFADQSHMCRFFRRMLGDTPTRYRRGHVVPALPVAQGR